MGVIYRLMLTLILSLHLITIYAENENPFFFSHLGVEDGLSQVSILSIFQDSEGYIWFGTRNGANRYDGYEFKVYQNEVNNPASISDNYIRKIRQKYMDRDFQRSQLHRLQDTADFPLLSAGHQSADNNECCQ